METETNKVKKIQGDEVSIPEESSAWQDEIRQEVSVFPKSFFLSFKFFSAFFSLFLFMYTHSHIVAQNRFFVITRFSETKRRQFSPIIFCVCKKIRQEPATREKQNLQKIGEIFFFCLRVRI